MNKEHLHVVINNFRNVLISGIESVISSYSLYSEVAKKNENDFAVSFEDYYHDWTQCQWELLIERVICKPGERITTYGVGTDYDPSEHSHVFFQEMKATHDVICVPIEKPIDYITGKEIELTNFKFNEFVGIDNNWFTLKKSFDHIILDEVGVYGGDYRQVVIPNKSIKFDIIEIINNK